MEIFQPFDVNTSKRGGKRAEEKDRDRLEI